MVGTVVGSPRMVRGIRVCRVLNANYLLQYAAFLTILPLFWPYF
jgi:hypothetical protein